jgi:uncharacterized protein YjiS (DUF1127 family)
MLVKLATGIVIHWLRRRADRKARRNATYELSQSRDDMLRDIGVSRGEITSAFHSGEK